MDRQGSGGVRPVVMTGFDIERILRREGAPKAFAKAVAAACRTAGLFDRIDRRRSSISLISNPGGTLSRILCLSALHSAYPMSSNPRSLWNSSLILCGVIASHLSD